MTQCENRILQLLDWDLVSLSPENFTTSLLSFGIVFSDDTINQSGHELQKFLKSIRMFTEMFTDISLQSMEM